MEPEIITKRMVGECSLSVTDSKFSARPLLPFLKTGATLGVSQRPVPW